MERNTYDAIVIGARVAGASTAMLLARAGHRVLLVDKAEFPSDTVSTHNLTLAAMASLKRWGLFEAVARSGCTPVRSVIFDIEGLVLEGWDGPLEGVDVLFNPRRTVLDQLLVDAAREAGVEVRLGFMVDELIIENGTVRGVRGRTKGDVRIEARATIVVGADGRHSRVPAAMGAEEYRHLPARTFTYYSYFSGLPTGGRMEFYGRDGQTIVVQPTSDGLTMLAVMQRAEGFKAFRSDVEGNFYAALEAVPGLAERVRKARREERFAGSVDVPNTMRVPYGPGFALVGDAGLHLDPTMGQGITNALRDAELLAIAIHAGLRGEAAMQEALAHYHEARDEAVSPMFDLVCEMVSGEPPSAEFIAALEALPGNQRQIDRFIGVMLGTVPVGDFYSPENLESIVAAANGSLQAAA